MENFELIDNLFQIAVLLCACVAAGILAIRHRNRSLLILSLAYACFAMGTIYYVLYLVIIGIWPQVFYVAEISWLAAWLFYLSVQILPGEGKKDRFSLPAGAAAAVIAAIAFLDHDFGPSYFVSALFSLTAGATMYLSVSHMQNGSLCRKRDLFMIICVTLQVLLYRVSGFTHDYTRFQLYYAVDLALTLSMAALLPLTLREVKREMCIRDSSGTVDPSQDNMLKITSDGRKLGLDQRIVNQMLPDEPGTKVNQCVDNIMQIWRDGKADKLTQLVFCDISTPQAKAPASKAAKTLDNPLLHALEGAVPLPEQEPTFTVYDDIQMCIRDRYRSSWKNYMSSLICKNRRIFTVLL